MNKVLTFFLLVFLLLLTGCEPDEEKIASGINEIQNEMKTIILESEIANYMDSEIQFDNYETLRDQGKSEDETVLMYNIILPMNPSFLELEASKQYQLLIEPTQKLFDYQGDDNRWGVSKGKAIGDYVKERIKHELLILTFGNDTDKYTISLNNEQVKYTRVDNNGELKNSIFANITNEKYVILFTGGLLPEGEYTVMNNYAIKRAPSYSAPKTTTGGNTQNKWDADFEREFRKELEQDMKNLLEAKKYNGTDW